MNKQTKQPQYVPTMFRVYDSDTKKQLKGDIGFYLAKDCSLYIKKEHVKKLAWLSKQRLIELCSMLRFERHTAAQLVEYFDSHFSIDLLEKDSYQAMYQNEKEAESKEQVIYYRYDSIQQSAIEQHEIMLVSIYKHFSEEIIRKRIEVKSSTSDLTVLNTIEIRVSRSMNINIVKATLEAMNTTAYYALRADERGEFFEMMSKEKQDEQ